MSTIVTVTHNSKQSFGYEVSVVDGSKAVEYRDRIGDDAGEAAALAIRWKARYPGSRIIGAKEVMEIVNG